MSPAVSSAAASSAPVGPRPGEAISVSGENGDFQLHSLGFSGSGMGWVIEDRYNSVSDSYRSQLLTTPDGGENWNEAGPDGMWLDTACFADPTEGWAVSKETDGSVKVPAGSPKQVRYSILGTEDGGANWSVRWKSAVSSENTASQLRFLTPETGFAMVGRKMLRTQDGGKSWTEVPSGLSDFVPKRFSFADAQNGWAAGSSGSRDRFSVLRTSDGGKSWRLQFQGTKQESGAAGVIDIDFISAREGWFLTSDMTTMNGTLYHTSDGGANWNSLGEQRISRPSAEGLCFTDSKTGWIPFSPGAGPVDGGLSVTHDGGKTFRILGETAAEEGGPGAITSANQVLFLSAQDGWAVGEDRNHGDYLLRTTDGGNTWEQRYPSPGPVNAFSFVSGETGFGLGELSDENALLETQDGGESWQKVTSFTGTYSAEGISFLSPSEGWVLAQASGNAQIVLHTLDGGKTWNRVGSFPSYAQSVYFRFFDAENGVSVRDAKKWEVFRTQDGGKTWNSVFAGFPNGALPDQAELSRLSGDPAKWNYYPETMGTSGGAAAALLPDGKGMVLTDTPSGRYELLLTADRGNTWDRHLMPESLGEETFESLFENCPMQITDDGHGWILTEHGILVTADGGTSWKWEK